MSELVDDLQPEIDKSDEKKQNDIQARREARRRRILENAKSRLDKLSGADRDTSPTNKCRNHSTETYSDPEIEYPEYTSMNNYNHAYTTASTSNHMDWESSPLLGTPTVIPPTKFEKFLFTRVHIIAASAFTYILLALDFRAIISRSLFALFLAMECAELVTFRKEKPLSPIINMVLMLSGINLAKASAFIKVFGLLNRMLFDLGLFVFSFVIIHGFYCVFLGDTLDESFYSF